MLVAMARGEHAIQTSLDLGLTTLEITLTEQEAILPSGPISKTTLMEIAHADVNCFLIEHSTAKKIQAYSEAFERHYSLMPTEGAPTMLISGLPMHRIKNTNPHKDTLAKIRAAAPRGRVLDTATGLGYTAIEASKAAHDVVTIELDPVAQHICRINPWSRGLFDNPKIQQKIGDSFDVIETLEAESFSRIIHDPPMFSLAGHLYSGDFYAEMFRVLKPGGRAFHYIGDPESKSGSRVTRGVVERLKKAGFARVASAAEAFGVVAFKST
jgi:predicted methyltransferase